MAVRVNRKIVPSEPIGPERVVSGSHCCSREEYRPMPDIQVAFGHSVRRWRKKRKMSQEALADAAGLHATFIGRCERGKQNSSLQTIRKLARALRVKPGDLFKGIR